VAILGETAAEPLHRAIFAEVAARGGHPMMLPGYDDLGAVMMRHGRDNQLRFVSPIERFVSSGADGVVTALAESNTKALSGVDPERDQVAQRARTALLKEFTRRAADGVMDRALTLYRTDAYAQDAGMATDEFAEFVRRACTLDTPDPVAAGKALAAEQQRLIDGLAGESELRLRGADPGETDLRLGVAGRIWLNADGGKNLPDGEIFTGPVETSAEGRVRFSFPVVTAGREVVDVRLRFEGGKGVDASAAQNEEYLHRALEADAGARVLGEFAVGTNVGITRFTKTIRFDEKIGGTVHVALGEGYPETGSANRSAVHWDPICDLRLGGEVGVDGQAFLRDGRFLA
jgi:aminopeptidase